MTARVRLLGPASQERVRQLHAGADRVLPAELLEGVPVVLMEAMAMEVPVVATRITGVPELVEEGRSGFLVPPGRRIRRLARASAARGSAEAPAMGAAGRARVEAEFDQAHSAERLLELLAYAT